LLQVSSLLSIGGTRKTRGRKIFASTSTERKRRITAAHQGAAGSISDGSGSSG
jgi:hypothetical protein